MQPIIEKKFESESTQCFLANEFDRNTKVYSINTVFSCLHLVGNSVRVWHKMFRMWSGSILVSEVSA